MIRLSDLKQIKHYDKWLHIGAGFIAAGAVWLGWFFLALTPSWFTVLASVTAGWAVGTWKEFQDKKDPANHTFDGWDAQATSLGAILANWAIFGVSLLLS